MFALLQSRRAIFFWLLLWTTLSWGETSPLQGRWKIKKQQVEITPAVLDAWKDDLFMTTNEYWMVKHSKEKTFRKLLDRYLSPEVIHAIDHTPNDNDNWDIPDLELGRYDRVFVIPSTIKKAVSKYALNAIYTFIFRHGKKYPFFKFNKRREAKNFIRLLQRRHPEDKDFFTMEDFIRPNNAYYWFVTPDRWQYLDDNQKLKLIDEMKSGRTDSIQVSLEIRNETQLFEILTWFKIQPTHVDLRPWVAPLRSGKTVTIPLQDLLPEEIQRYYSSYCPVSGPCCWSTLASCLPSHETWESMEQAPFLKMAYDKHRNLSEEESPRFGDWMLYFQDGELIHASIFVAQIGDNPEDAIVLSKNGYSRFSPFAAYWKRDVEQIYFPDAKKSDYVLAFLRKMGDPEDLSPPEEVQARFDRSCRAALMVAQ